MKKQVKKVVPPKPAVKIGDIIQFKDIRGKVIDTRTHDRVKQALVSDGGLVVWVPANSPNTKVVTGKVIAMRVW